MDGVPTPHVDSCLPAPCHTPSRKSLSDGRGEEDTGTVNRDKTQLLLRTHEPCEHSRRSRGRRTRGAGAHHEPEIRSHLHTGFKNASAGASKRHLHSPICHANRGW